MAQSIPAAYDSVTPYGLLLGCPLPDCRRPVVQQGGTIYLAFSHVRISTRDGQWLTRIWDRTGGKHQQHQRSSHGGPSRQRLTELYCLPNYFQIKIPRGRPCVKVKRARRSGRESRGGRGIHLPSSSSIRRQARGEVSGSKQQSKQSRAEQSRAEQSKPGQVSKTPESRPRSQDPGCQISLSLGRTPGVEDYLRFQRVFEPPRDGTESLGIEDLKPSLRLLLRSWGQR
jgi:hypothetical protein